MKLSEFVSQQIKSKDLAGEKNGKIFDDRDSFEETRDCVLNK